MRRMLMSLGVLLTIMTAGSVQVISSPIPAQAVECGGNFFGMPPWYRNLTGGGCEVVPPQQDDNGIARFVGNIFLNLLQSALVVAGYVALFFILKGGFMYITSAGATDRMAAAKKTLVNAIIGLFICVTSAMIVNAISAAFSGAN